jgi:single-stranded DNA-binding protein
MNYVSIYGRLTADPKQIPTKNEDTVMAVGSIAVDIETRSDEPQTEFFGLVCFGRQAKSLLRHVKGDSLAISGRLQLNIYQNKRDEEIRQFQVVCDSVIGARSSRQGGKRSSNTKSKPAQYPGEFNDPLPI